MVHFDPPPPADNVTCAQTRRDALADHLGEDSVSAATAGRESLADYTDLTEVAQGRFSVVFYAENKVGGWSLWAVGGRGKGVPARPRKECSTAPLGPIPLQVFLGRVSKSVACSRVVYDVMSFTRLR